MFLLMFLGIADSGLNKSELDICMHFSGGNLDSGDKTISQAVGDSVQQLSTPTERADALFSHRKTKGLTVLEVNVYHCIL